MANNRRYFLKVAGMAGLSGAAGGMGSCDSLGISAKEKDAQQVVPHDEEWSRVKYGKWGGPGVSEGPGPMDDVLVKDHAPRSSLITTETFIEKPLVPVIDVHAHDYPGRVKEGTSKEALDKWVQTQREAGVEKTVILTGATGERFDKLADLYLGSYPERFQLFCGLESKDLHTSKFEERAATELERCYRNGARGVGELTDKGFGLTGDRNLAAGERLHADDDRLVAFWSKCAELKLPVNIHIADHPSAWLAPDAFQERTPIFQQYNQYKSEGLAHAELIDTLPRMLKKNAGTTFIACHLANLGHDLKRLAAMLDAHANLFVDISARDYEVGRQPRGAAKFLTAYADRVLFGTDMGMDKAMYHNWWRLLESADEYMEGRIWWRYYGLELPAQVLKALYRDNAQRILNHTGI